MEDSVLFRLFTRRVKKRSYFVEKNDSKKNLIVCILRENLSFRITGVHTLINAGCLIFMATRLQNNFNYVCEQFMY